MYKTIIDPSGLPNLAYFTCVDSFNCFFVCFLLGKYLDGGRFSIFFFNLVLFFVSFLCRFWLFLFCLFGCLFVVFVLFVCLFVVFFLLFVCLFACLFINFLGGSCTPLMKSLLVEYSVPYRNDMYSIFVINT